MAVPFPAAPPRRLPSPATNVSLWWCSTLAALDSLETLRGWLSDDEHRRASRFSQPERAASYVIGRATLRHILGTLMGVAPQDVMLERGARGRPRLAGGGPIDFNVSNTRDVALIAVSTEAGTRIGVDVEHLAREVRHEGLARKFCTPSEQAGLVRLEGQARRERFLLLWTCKEAMSKATGDALTAPLGRLDVEVEPVLRLVAGPAPYVPDRWSLLDAAVPGDYVATVALWRPPVEGAAGFTR